MSTLKTTNIAHPSATGTNIVLNSDDSATFSQIAGGAITSGTSVASTSGTSIDFTGIPSWVKRITVMFDGVSTNGTSKILLQLGDASGIETSNYLGGATFANDNSAGTNFSSGFIADQRASASGVRHGMLILSLVNPATYTWCSMGNVGNSDDPSFSVTAGSKALSDTLTQVRITTVNGTDTFDAGTINILYEG
jgi:hypothetical protein